MTHVLFEVTPLNGNTPVTLRMSMGTPDPSGVQINGYSWLPVIKERSAWKLDLTSNGLLSEAQSDYGTVSFWVHPDFNNQVWTSYTWNGALARVFIGNLGDPFSSYTQTFEGSVGSIKRDGAIATVALFGSEATLDTPLLTATYAGTGNAEGPTSLQGTLKPRAYGNCQCVDPILIDPAHWIYQVHGYGAVSSINVYEFAQALDPAKKKPDCANYAALAALTLVPGEWGTCLAEGLFRLGATPAKKVSADVLVSSATTIATIVPLLLGVAGVPGAKIGSFSAFSSVSWNLYQKEQVSVGDAARSAMLQAGGYLLADGTGVWQEGNYFAPKTATTISADRTSKPLIRNIKEVEAGDPVWKVNVNYDRCWNVHSPDEVSPAIADISAATTTAQAAADAAQATASTAAANATTAITRITSMANANVLDRVSKAAITREFATITAEYSINQSRASGLGISTELTAYTNAYNTLNTYLAGLSPAYTDTTQDTTIVGTTFKTNFTNYYTTRQTLLNAIASYTTQRVPSNLLGIGSSANIILDPNFADQSLWQVVGSNINFVTATQSITPAGVVTADTSSAADLATMGALKATKSLGNGTSGRWGSPKYQIPGPGTYVGTIRILIKAGGNFGGSIGLTFYDKNGAGLTSNGAAISYASVTQDTMFDATATAVAPAGAVYVGFNPNFASTGSTFYMALPSIRPVSTPGLVNLADTTNMVPDADFLDPAITWSMSAAWSQLPNSTAGLGAGKNKLRLDTSKTGSCTTAKIPCGPNVSLYMSIYRNYVSGTTGQTYVALVALDAAGASLGYVPNAALYDASGTSGRFATIGKTPANTAAIQLLLYNYSGGDRVVDFSEPIVKKVTVTGTDIVAADGTTVLTNNAIITNIGTAAFIANQGAGATANTLAQLDATASTKLTGIAAGATNTTAYTQSTAPTSPNNGDIWNDTSTNPISIKLRVNGSWVTAATKVTGTSSIPDDAGLGTKATWSGVIGTGTVPTNIAGLSGGESILNNSMSITAAGQLLGGGGGQVTIGGLGYAGDLKATRNDDMTNMFQAPYALDKTSFQGGAFRQVSGSPGRPADNIRCVMPSNASVDVLTIWDTGSNGYGVPVQPGDVLFYGQTIYREAACTDNVWASYNAYRSDGSFINAYGITTATTSPADAAGQWLRKTGTITVPAGAASILVYVVRTHATSPGSYYVAEPYLGRSQQGADVTATNQVQVTYTTSKTISADYTGVIASGVLPTTVPAPKVTLGGVDVTQTDNVQYSIVNATGGCSGNVTVDTTNGSGTKGVQLIGTGFNSSGGYQLQITVNGYALPLISVTVTKKLADPPVGGGGGGGGGGSGATSASMSTGGYGATSTTYAQVGSILTNLTVASGKTASLSGGDDYSCYGGSGLLGNVTAAVKWQYSVTGANAWTDVGSASVGSSASYNQKTGDETPGSVNCSASVAPSAGSYDFRLLAKINSGSSGATVGFQGTGAWSVNIA